MAPDFTGFNFFRFKKTSDDRYLLTNDTGHFVFLSGDDFHRLGNDLPSLSADTTRELRQRCFLNDREGQEQFVALYRRKNAFITAGPSLHILVATLRCDHSCVYCHASRKNADRTEFDMSVATGKKAIDFALQSTDTNLCIEFQGGEPLLNFELLRELVPYARGKQSGKNLIFSVVTNLSAMDEEKLRFLLDNRVSICTSLDGPAEIHNGHRPAGALNGFENAVRWIKRIQEENRKREGQGQKFDKVNALLTTTRKTFAQFREIIDLYVELGFSSIHLRPINQFGFGKNLRKSLLYTSEEFIDFYRRSLDYIIELNERGVVFHESTAKIILNKVIRKLDSNFLDLRSPCGAGIGQVAYNYDGKIYTCDEGRMVAEMGDDIFLIGDLDSCTYDQAMQSETVRSLCVASCLEGNPGCSDCVYHPYCGVCPVYNYVAQGNIFGQMPGNERCRIMTGIFDYLFSKIEKHEALFSRWFETL